MVDVSKLKRWRSHKVVHAAKIIGVGGLDVDGCLAITIQLADGSTAGVDLEAKMIGRYMPGIGDYYVVYEDGYASISPRLAFEEGYDAL